MHDPDPRFAAKNLDDSLLVTATATIAAHVRKVNVVLAAADITLTLPNASVCEGAEVVITLIKTAGTNDCDVVGPGAISVTTGDLDAAFDTVIMKSTGHRWVDMLSGAGIA
jgi:hypothetical protein